MKNDRSFTTILRELAEGSSLHGIPKTVSSKQLPVKVLWCLLFIGTCTVFGLQLYNLFSAYYSYPIQTGVSLKFSALRYPAVTFCNMNPVKLSQIDSYPTLKEVINPKRKKPTTTGANNRRKREAPVSSLPFTSMQQTSDVITPTSVVASSEALAPTPTSFESSVSQAPTPSLQMSNTPSLSQASTPNLQTSITQTASQTPTRTSVQADQSVFTPSSGDTSVQTTASSISSTEGMTLTPTPAQVDQSVITSSPGVTLQTTTIQNTASIVDSAEGVSSTGILPSSESMFISPSSVVVMSTADVDSGVGSGSGSSDDSSNYDGSGSGTGSSYYYDYDYWGNWWDPWYSYDRSNYSYDDYSYFGSGYYSSGSMGNYYDGYSDNYDYNYGLNSFVHDQLYSPKDQWDERIVDFQAQFKNETITSREDMGHAVKDMVVSASFARSLQNVSKFEHVMTTEYGNCYTMTSPKYLAMRSGPTNGIKLTLNLEMDEYIKNFASGYGIRIVFHEPGTFPLPADEGMTLSPGFETSIGLRLVQVGRLGPPHGHCSDGGEFFSKYNIRYSVTACMLICRVQRTIENCNCIPSDSPDLNITEKAVDICYTKRDKECQLKVDLSFDDGSSVENCDCVSPCKEVVYQKTMSGRRWPNDDYLENVLMQDICSRNITSMDKACAALANRTFDPDVYRYNFLRVLIYFEDLNYEIIDQEPLYEGVRFLSDIGGAMGLFMGASLLSFVEVLQLILEMVLYVFRAKIPQNQIRKISHQATATRKDSLYPQPEKIRTTIYEETNLNLDPNLVSKY